MGQIVKKAMNTDGINREKGKGKRWEDSEKGNGKDRREKGLCT